MATRHFPVYMTLLVAAGCSHVDPLGSGTMAVDWQVSPSGCEDAGVDVVEVRAAGPDSIVERYACSSGGATLEDVTPGGYRLELFGFDAAGTAIFVSDPVHVDIDADARTQTPTVRLLAAPATVGVSWTFENGRVCGANDVRWISVGAFDEFDYEVATAQFACDDGEGTLPPLRAGSYLIEVNALDNDRIVWRGTAPLKVGRAEDVVLDVELAPAE